MKYGTFQKVNNKGTDQTARMRRLVCACVVRKPQKTGFLESRPNYGRIGVTVLTDSFKTEYEGEATVSTNCLISS